jgi:hypothetical protein
MLRFAVIVLVLAIVGCRGYGRATKNDADQVEARYDQRNDAVIYRSRAVIWWPSCRDAPFNTKRCGLLADRFKDPEHRSEYVAEFCPSEENPNGT